MFDGVLRGYSTLNIVRFASSSFRALPPMFRIWVSIEQNPSHSKTQSELLNALEWESVSCSSLLTWYVIITPRCIFSRSKLQSPSICLVSSWNAKFLTMWIALCCLCTKECIGKVEVQRNALLLSLHSVMRCTSPLSAECWPLVFTLHFHCFRVEGCLTARFGLYQLSLMFDEVLRGYSTSNIVRFASSSFRALPLMFRIWVSIEQNPSHLKMQSELLNALELE